MISADYVNKKAVTGIEYKYKDIINYILEDVLSVAENGGFETKIKIHKEDVADSLWDASVCIAKYFKEFGYDASIISTDNVCSELKIKW